MKSTRTIETMFCLFITRRFCSCFWNPLKEKEQTAVYHHSSLTTFYHRLIVKVPSVGKSTVCMWKISQSKSWAATATSGTPFLAVLLSGIFSVLGTAADELKALWQQFLAPLDQDFPATLVPQLTMAQHTECIHNKIIMMLQHKEISKKQNFFRGHP